MEDINVLERILAGSEEPRHLPLQLLKSITENFSLERKIGAGGFGEVYKGVLQNGCYVALKKITVSSHTIDDRQFKREVTSLLKTINNHPNVVRFLGFCSNSHREVIKKEGSEDAFLAEIRERIICFEHIDNGSLDKHITDELRGHEWNIRYQVIMGVCEGLQYLHKKHIIHMDLKPTNIMVDSHMVPKITDFGLSRSDEKSRTTGDRFRSRGYCAPEYDISGMTSFKCDIYSLGVIIAELVTGRKGIPDKNNVLRRWRHRWNRSARHTPSQDQQVTKFQVTKCIEIAERCMENEPKERPSISDIIRSLNEIGNKKFHISEQISPPSDDDDMLGIEPLELRFSFELNKEISRAVELTNGTCNCIAFNFETVSQLLYSTQPSKGTVPSQSKRTVNIKLQAQETSPGHMHRPDEFIVHSVTVEDGLADEDITEDMFNNEAANKVVDEVNLTVVYDEYNKQRVNPSLEPASKDINSSSNKDARGQSTKRLNFHPPQTNSSPNVGCLYKATDRAMDLMTGAMGSLLPKLRQLLNQEHNLQTNVKEDVESLEEQLMDMYTALCNVSHEQLHQLDPQDKRWANKVRELSYDIEDIVDDLLVHIARSEPITNQDGFWGLIHRMFNLIKWGKTHYHIARTIEDIKVRVKKVANKHEGFKLGNFLANPTATSSIDPRLLAFYEDHRNLVGIDGPRDDLEKRLMSGDDGVSTQQLKIISIFGDGGSGKTTLAKALYDKHDVKFHLKAFVPVGRNPDMKVVLENILLDLDKKTYADIHTKSWNEMNLIGELQDVLRNKRYLIVIDDIWDIPSWEIIERALIDSSCGSKIITTSRNFEVAKRSGEVCKLEPLSNDDSKELFCARLFGRKGTCSFDLPNEQSTKYILQKCGGVPLAIITIASLLADKPMDYWPTVYNSIGFENEDNTEVNKTRQILLFSYYDLPWHLKTCLLYLSIFSEDREIEKDTLVWRWVAQGFVHEEPGKTIFKVGERYFHELINRCMIQPIVKRGTYTICACCVHDMVLDMICSMAKEENFVTILGSDEQHLSSQSNARILAIQKRVLEQHDLASKLKPTTVRTFNATRCHISSMMSLLQTFQVLRVLSLEDCIVIGDTNHLKNLSGLVHLRYLGLRGTCLGELPMEMEHLTFLQTLDLRDTKIETLPHSVTLLRQLKCLRTGLHIKELPAGMGNLTSLEELKLHLPADFSNFSKELGKLTELRVLDIQRGWCHHNRNDYAIHESLSNLQKIEELALHAGVLVDEPNWDGFLLSVQLRRLFLHIYSCGGLPVVWMNASLVPNLCHLDVTVKSVEARDLDHLGGLSELLSLVLYISEKPFHIVIAAGSFPKLRYCNLSGLLLTYQRGAMPCLIDVRFTVQVRGLKDANFDFRELDSLMYLPLLEEIIPSIKCWDAKTEEVQEAEAAVRHAIHIHPNCPSFDIFKYGTCADEPPLRWMQQSKLMQALMPKSMKDHVDHVLHSQQRDVTHKSKSNDNEGQTRSRGAEESDSK